MEFYHIDKTGALTVGQTITLETDLPPSNIAEMFPEGLSLFGQKCTAISCYYDLCDDLSSFKLVPFDELATLNLELIFELVRRQRFPDKPSRFQSFYVLEDLLDYSAWSELCKNKSFQIVKVSIDHDNYAKYDSSFLVGGLAIDDRKPGYFDYSAELYIKNAIKYWSGEHSSHPRFEILVKPPLTVTGIIPFVSSQF